MYNESVSKTTQKTWRYKEMTNELIKLEGFRKIYDLIYAWVNPNAPQIYISFEVDDGYVNLIVEGERHNAPINESVIHEVEDLFLSGCDLVDCDPAVRVYNLGNTDIKFDSTTVDLLNFATDEGFVIHKSNFASTLIDKDTLIDFIMANPTFTISVRDNGVVVSASK